MTKLARVSGGVQEGSLYALLFLLPFSKAAIEVLFGVLFFGWLADRLNPKTRVDTLWLRPALRPLALAIGSYAGVCALSLAVSDHRWLSVRGLIGKWLEYLLFFVIVTDVAHRPRVATRSLSVLACSSLGVVIHGLIQEVVLLRPYSLHPVHLYQRMTGPYENPIDLATYFMVIIPLVLVDATVRRKAIRWPLWVLLLLLVGCLVRTEAIGAWLGLGVGLLVMTVLNTAARRPGLILLATLILAGGVFLHHQGRASTRLSLSDIGVVDRWYMWQAAMRMISDRPVLGHGLNTFMANYLDYWVGGERQPRYAHNCYLQVAAETGILGLLVFVGLLWLLFVRLVAGLRRARSDHQVIVLGYTAGLFAFALQAGVDTNFYALRQAALFWVVAGMALELSERPEALRS